MIIVKLSRPGYEDQLCELEPGDHRLGSDFSCEIALIHPELAPEHLTLRVSEGAAWFSACQGALVTLLRGAAQRSIPAEPQAWTPLYPGDRLRLADILLELDGVKPERPGKGGAVQRLWKAWPSRVVAIATILLVCFAVIANLLFLRHSPAANASPRALQPLAAADPIASSPSLDKALVTRELQALGARIERVNCQGESCHATLRVDDVADRERVQAKLKDIRVPLSADVFADKEIASVTELIAANLGIEARVLRNEHGIITLSAIPDTKLREKLAGTLKTDVPGLVAVRFEVASPVDLESMAKRVTGVWVGAYPYVVTKDGAIVRPGDALEHDVKLVSITSKHLLVEVDGRQQKVIVR